MQGVPDLLIMLEVWQPAGLCHAINNNVMMVIQREEHSVYVCYGATVSTTSDSAYIVEGVLSC